MMNKKRLYEDPKYIAAASAMAVGIAIHLFGLANVLHNHENITMQPTGYGAGITSGRWLLTILGDFVTKCFGGYNVSWMLGLIFIFLLAIATYYMVAIFQIRKRLFASLIGIICVSFPSVTSTMFYRFTVVYYGFSVVLAVLAAYVVIKAKKRFVFPCILSALLIACSLGIYQAYVPLTISIFVLYLLQQLLNSNKTWNQIICRGLYFCLSLILGIVLYFLLLKGFLILYHTQLSTYQGIDKMGAFRIQDLPLLVYNAIITFFTMPIRNYCMLAPIPILKLAYPILGILTLVTTGLVLVQRKTNAISLIVAIALLAVFPIAVNFIVIMCPNGSIYTLMVYPFIFVLLAPIIIFETLPEPDGKPLHLKSVCSKAITALLIIIIFCYSYLTNVNYTGMYYANRQVENYFTSMVAQIRMTEGFTSDKKWAFIGKLQDPLLNNVWQDIPFYEGTYDSKDLVSGFGWYLWFPNYIGYEIPHADSRTTEDLRNSDTVKNMPCWPNHGSIQIVDDVVVIKFHD